MKIISFIEDDEVIKRILKHLGLWNKKVYPPKAKACHIDALISQAPASDNWLYVDPQYTDEFSA